MKRFALVSIIVMLVGCGRGESPASGASAPIVPPPIAAPPVVVPPGAVDLGTTTLESLRGQWGKPFFLDCTPGRTGTVWGSGLYTDDSDPCRAAVHAGVLPQAMQGRIVGYVAPPTASFTGSTQNGITTENYDTWPAAFQFTPPDPRSLPPAGHVALAWDQSATEKRGSPGTYQVWCPPGGAVGTVWGSGPYTDDSSVCTAAVHAGAIQLAPGGAFRVTIGGAGTSFSGSTQNGVTTLDYGEYPGSFTIAR